MDQLDRIKQKLIEAQKVDKSLSVFGADKHKYILHNPITEEEISAFESKFNVNIPDAYRQFITKIGNGGTSYQNSGTGPYYGVYKFGEQIDAILTEPNTYLSLPCPIFPNITDEEWNKMTRKGEELIDNEYMQINNFVFQGLLPIGTQGCSYETVLVIGGDYKGRIIYVDISMVQKPKFAYEDNFLDWYERWLDEVIAGYLFDTPSWFGYSIGGNDIELIEKINNTSDENLKITYINGLFKMPKIEEATIVFLEKEINSPNSTISYLALKLLTKHDYYKAKSFLKSMVYENSITVFNLLSCHAKPFADEWIEEIKHLLSNDSIDEELFLFITYVLADSQWHNSYLIIPYCSHKNEEIRTQARYTLHKMKPVSYFTYVTYYIKK